MLGVAVGAVAGLVGVALLVLVMLMRVLVWVVLLMLVLLLVQFLVLLSALLLPLGRGGVAVGAWCCCRCRRCCWSRWCCCWCLVVAMLMRVLVWVVLLVFVVDVVVGLGRVAAGTTTTTTTSTSSSTKRRGGGARSDPPVMVCCVPTAPCGTVQWYRDGRPRLLQGQINFQIWIRKCCISFFVVFFFSGLYSAREMLEFSACIMQAKLAVSRTLENDIANI